MSTYLALGTTEWRFHTNTDLTGATLTMLATRGAAAPTTIPVAIASDVTSDVILQTGALALGNYRIQLKAVRNGKTSFFPSTGPEELNIVTPPV